MARKESRDKREKKRKGDTPAGSLVPEIEQEEKRLAEAVDTARKEAESVIQEAHKEAARRIEEAKKEVPGLVAGEREKGLSSVDAQLSDIQQRARDELSALKNRADSRVDRAADLLVSRLFSDGEDA